MNGEQLEFSWTFPSSDKPGRPPQNSGSKFKPRPTTGHDWNALTAHEPER